MVDNLSIFIIIYIIPSKVSNETSLTFAGIKKKKNTDNNQHIGIF